MTQDKLSTRERLISAALKLFYSEGIGAVTVDAIAAKAGVSKRTLYYHFSSKDDLIVAYLEAKDQPSRALLQRWFTETFGDVAAKTRGIFRNLMKVATNPRWKGCGFLRTSAELANKPGHPALKVGSIHKKKLESWLQAQYEDAGIVAAAPLARQVVILLDGSFADVLLHKDSAYMEMAGDAAYKLVAAEFDLQLADPTSLSPEPLLVSN
jgi:AcrR family transcriptional regulator